MNMRTIFKTAVFKCVLFLAIFAIGMPAHADNNEVSVEAVEARNTNINFGLGSFGIGGMFPFGSIDYPNLDITFSLLEIGVENNKSNIGIIFSPFTMLIRENGFYAEAFFSFLNLNLYWNILSYRGIFFGLSTSVSYLIYDGGFCLNRRMITAGLRGGLRLEVGHVNMHLLTVETGFRSVDGENGFFFGAKIDLLPLLTRSLFTPRARIVRGGRLWSLSTAPSADFS